MKIEMKVTIFKKKVSIIIVGYSNSINAQFKGGQWLYKSIVYKKVCVKWPNDQVCMLTQNVLQPTDQKQKL